MAVRGKPSSRQKLKKIADNAPYLFFKDRAASFKKFLLDSDKDAVCTSTKLALAGFYSTATKNSPTSAKCPFCLKELEFDPEDDPWEEHKKRGQMCEFVKLGKLNDKEWSVGESLFLGSVCSINQEYEQSLKLVEELEAANSTENLTKMLGSVPVKPKRSRKAK